MNTNQEQEPLDPMDPEIDGGLSKKIIGCAINVSNGLGIHLWFPAFDYVTYPFRLSMTFIKSSPAR